MQWYIPITILPGVGMLILSTSGQMLSLSTEIGQLLTKRCSEFEHRISEMKIKQLGRLTKASTLLYLSCACFVLSGLAGVFFTEKDMESIPRIILILGVLLMLAALFYLINYGFRTIKIRRLQHTHSMTIHEKQVQ